MARVSACTTVEDPESEVVEKSVPETSVDGTVVPTDSVPVPPVVFTYPFVVKLEKENVPAVIATELLPKAIVGSVAPASYVQVNPDPDPNVVLPISVVSRVRVTVVPDSVVSIPLVPPATVTVFD
jgi:hypothetical protein